MSQRMRAIMILGTVISFILSSFFLLSFRGTFEFGSLWLDASAAIMNGVLLLILYRHIFKNPDLAENERHHWSIVVFLGLAAGQLLYLIRRFA